MAERTTFSEPTGRSPQTTSASHVLNSATDNASQLDVPRPAIPHQERKQHCSKNAEQRHDTRTNGHGFPPSPKTTKPHLELMRLKLCFKTPESSRGLCGMIVPPCSLALMLHRSKRGEVYHETTANPSINAASRLSARLSVPCSAPTTLPPRRSLSLTKTLLDRRLMASTPWETRSVWNGFAVCCIGRLRRLLRLRYTCQTYCKGTKNRVSGILLSRGFVYREGKSTWTKRQPQWLARLRKESEGPLHRLPVGPSRQNKRSWRSPNPLAILRLQSNQQEPRSLHSNIRWARVVPTLIASARSSVLPCDPRT